MSGIPFEVVEKDSIRSHKGTTKEGLSKYHTIIEALFDLPESEMLKLDVPVGMPMHRYRTNLSSTLNRNPRIVSSGFRCATRSSPDDERAMFLFLAERRSTS